MVGEDWAGTSWGGAGASSLTGSKTVFPCIAGQSHTRSRKASIFLIAIAEEAVDESSSRHKKSNSVKTKRRLGVSHLRIPRVSQLLRAVQGEMHAPSSPSSRRSSSPPPSPLPPAHCTARGEEGRRRRMRGDGDRVAETTRGQKSLLPTPVRPPHIIDLFASRGAALAPALARGGAGRPDAADGWDDEACDLFYDKVPPSPLIAPSPASSEAALSPVSASPMGGQPRRGRTRAVVSAPRAPAVHGLEPLPPRLAAAPLQLRLAALAVEAEAAQSPSCAPSAFPAPSPQLRSHWSSSTISSVHSAHAPSPKTFAFAPLLPQAQILFLPLPLPLLPYSVACGACARAPDGEHLRDRRGPEGEEAHRRGRERARRRAARGAERARVRVAQRVRRAEAVPLPSSTLSSSSALSPATPGAQWASYPASPASPSPYTLGHVHSASTPGPSPALHATYTTQR
ncbi:hypothetical protein FB451DRAFT_1169253 [Mycena latifolia]|nr:hypothetical protein FB451DRAFT_1169253 [Mycena latifolia]